MADKEQKRSKRDKGVAIPAIPAEGTVSSGENDNMDMTADQPVSDQPVSDQPVSDQTDTIANPDDYKSLVAAAIRGRAVYDPLLDPLQHSPDQVELIRQGIADGHIFTSPAASMIRAKSNKATNQDEAQPFIAYLAKDALGAIILASGKEEPQTEAPEDGDDSRSEFDKQLGMVDYFNHGWYLKRYNNYVRDMLLDSIAGPEKEIAKRVKSLLEGKLAKTEAIARARVIKYRMIEGLPVPASDLTIFLEKHKLTTETLEAWRLEQAEE
jgi:hypothetical protein